MGVFSKLEELSEKFIEGIFKGKNASLQPVEIAKKLEKEMERQRKIGVAKTYVPNEYKVMLGSSDKEKLDVLKQALFVELASYLKVRAREKGFVFGGELSILLEEKEEFKAGQINVESSFSEEPKNLEQVFEQTQVFSQVATAKNPGTIKVARRVELIIIRGQDEGMTFRLGNQCSYIGRRKANDIFIDDANVSRKHALIENIDEVFYISDMESLNGTFVNGQEVSRKRLEDGDSIKVGTTLLRFRQVAQ